MFPEISGKPEINYDLLQKKHILFDLVYNPEETAFLKEGRKEDVRSLQGLKNALFPAERSWEIWNDPGL